MLEAIVDNPSRFGDVIGLTPAGISNEHTFLIGCAAQVHVTPKLANLKDAITELLIFSVLH